MPELPELEVIEQRLRPLIVGKRIKELKILKPYILKNHFDNSIRGARVKDILRRGKYLEFWLTSYKIYVHLMLHGSIEYALTSAHVKKSVCAMLVMEDGTRIEFSERTSKKRMSVYIIPKDESLAGVEKLGIEPLSDEFTVAALSTLLKKERKQLKMFLCRQSKIAGIGNAYADEILWKAGQSPFKLSKNLRPQEIERLYNAIIDVLKWAIQEVMRSKRLDKRDFLQIHGKRGQPCPVCGDTIKSVSFSQSDTYYCPTCQTGGKKLKDRRMSKFYR